jgi:hypothetical protein
MLYMLKKIPEELRRLAVVGVIAGIVATGVIYSSSERVAAVEDAWLGSKQAFQQPKNRPQAEGWFTATSSTDRLLAEGSPARPVDRALGAVAPAQHFDVAEIKAAEIQNTITLPRSRPTVSGSPGSYFELVRVQGDGEGQYTVVERKCIPKVDMPEPCYLPERGRRNFPLRRE